MSSIQKHVGSSIHKLGVGTGVMILDTLYTYNNKSKSAYIRFTHPIVMSYIDCLVLIEVPLVKTNNKKPYT